MNAETEFEAKQFRTLLILARQEDLGDTDNLTSMLLPETSFRATGSWALVAREAGRFCGEAILPALLETQAPEVKLEWIMPDADRATVAPGQTIARFSGLVCQMLAAERTILNFLQRLCGVATMTSRYVAAVADRHTKIYDTRKTTPGHRGLEKYAVRCGGGHNHRSGLYDAVLIKDNHLAGIPINRLSHAVFQMLNRLETLPSSPAFVEVECDCLEQTEQLLGVVGIDVILLDNFTPSDLKAAVQMRDKAGLRGKVELEASGGVTLERIGEIAATGVERIAVGAITHSAGILDLGLDAV